MVSKTAISYDVHQAREHLVCGELQEALRQIRLVMENLDFLMHPPGRGNSQKDESKACGADEFGRQNVWTLRLFCKQAARAITQGARGRACSVLDTAQNFWDALPEVLNAESVREAENRFKMARKGARPDGQAK